MRAGTAPTIRLICVWTWLAFALSGCAVYDVQSEYDAAATELSAFDTYAWVTEPASPDTTLESASAHESAVSDESLAQRIQLAVDANLTERGWRSVPKEDANVLVGQYTTVELKQQDKDAYYAFYAVELYEQGALTIEFIDPMTDHMVWQGTGRTRLRTVGAANGFDLTPPRLFDKPEPRDWRVEEMVDAILVKFPPNQ